VVKLDLRFPYVINARIKAAQEIAERPGYEIYKDDLNRVCNELMLYDELRHFMAHGFMRMDVDRAGNHKFEFLRYDREGEGKFTMKIARTNIERLRQAVEDIGDYVSHTVRLFEQIYREQKTRTKGSPGIAALCPIAPGVRGLDQG
jgi:hypothetical protein